MLCELRKEDPNGETFLALDEDELDAEAQITRTEAEEKEDALIVDDDGLLLTGSSSNLKIDTSFVSNSPIEPIRELFKIIKYSPKTP